MPNSFKLEISVALSVNALFAKLAPTKAIGTMKIKFVQEAERRLLFIAPHILFTPSQNVLLICKSTGEKTSKVLVNSSLIASQSKVDFGRNKLNCETIKRFIETLTTKEESNTIAKVR